MIVPNLSREEFKLLFEKLDINLIQNDSNASIIYDTKTKQKLMINYLEKHFQISCLQEQMADQLSH